MPSLETARRIASIKNNGAKTIGQIHKENSDWLMDYTWTRDIQSKECYIYDFFHDSEPNLNVGMTYENTTKTKIDAKFIVSQYGSISKDQVAFHLMFRPSQKMAFSENDELYYFETDYRQKYNIAFPTSLYIDIPNEKGIYEKWLILTIEQGNQFIKFNILPCNYLFEWIEVSGSERYKRKMWGVDRQQLSYTNGVWRDYNFESLDNVDKAFLPLNEITKNIKYVGNDNNNQRMFISAKVDNALVWKVTKLENTKPIGIIQLTFSQTSFDAHRDYIEKDSNGNIIGLWANYYSSSIEPSTSPEMPSISSSITAKIFTSTSNLKINGSYKTLTFNVFDENNNDITNRYLNSKIKWSCFIENVDWTNQVTWKSTSKKNQIKIKFPNDMNQLSKILNVKCSINGKMVQTEIQLELTE